VVIVTDGKSHAFAPHTIARTGIRVTAVLIGDDALEAGIAHLAGMTGGQVFIATGSDAGPMVTGAVDAARTTFAGHRIVRERGVRVLNHEELAEGDVSLEYVARLLRRRYTDAPTIRKVLQTLWFQVNAGQDIFVVGTILDDLTVRGGTGWGAEFAKLCNKPLFVFDQAKDGWFKWTGSAWEARNAADLPVVAHPHFTGTGTRTLEDNGRQAIAALFQRSFA
jgi:hypothetical protein